MRIALTKSIDIGGIVVSVGIDSSVCGDSLIMFSNFAIDYLRKLSLLSYITWYSSINAFIFSVDSSISLLCSSIALLQFFSVVSASTMYLSNSLRCSLEILLGFCSYFKFSSSSLHIIYWISLCVLSFFTLIFSMARSLILIFSITLSTTLEQLGKNVVRASITSFSALDTQDEMQLLENSMVSEYLLNIVLVPSLESSMLLRLTPPFLRLNANQFLLLMMSQKISLSFQS